MRSLLDLDKAQLHRIDQAIATFALQPAAERVKKVYLLRALESERRELLRANPALRSSHPTQPLDPQRRSPTRAPALAAMIVAARKAENLVEAE